MEGTALLAGGARRAPPRPRHERGGAGRLPRPAGAREHPAGGARRRAATPACAPCTTSPRAGSPRRCASSPRRPAAASSSTVDRVPVSPETRRLCALLGADPLGLIASGSLLVCCDPAEAAGAGRRTRRRPASRPPTSASSPKRAPGSPRWSAAGRRPGRTSRPTRRRGCWPHARRNGKAAEARDGPPDLPASPGGRRPRRPQRAVSCQSMFISSQSSPSASRSSATGVLAGTETISSISNSGALVYGAGPQRRVDALDVDAHLAQQVRDRLHEAGVVHGPGVEPERQRRRPLRHAGVRRPHLGVHVAAPAERAEAVVEPAHGPFVAGDQHHHRELAAQVDHAAVLEVAASLGDVARDLVDEARAVVADGGEHGVVLGVHARDSSGIAGARQRLAPPAHASRGPSLPASGIVRG